MVEITATEQNIGKRTTTKNEDSLRDFWDSIKHTNIRIIGVPEGEESEKGPEKISEEILAENFPHMAKEIVNQVQEAQRVPGRINPRRNTPKHIVITLTKIKDKDKMLKATREKQQITYKGTPIKLSADFSTNSTNQREWHNIFSDEREETTTKNTLPSKSWLGRVWLYAFCLGYSPFRFDGAIKSFPDKQKLREFSTIQPAL